jgi:cytochrome P450
MDWVGFGCALLVVCFTARQWLWYRHNSLLPGPPGAFGLLGHIVDILALPKVPGLGQQDLLVWWAKLMTQFPDSGFFRLNFFTWTPLCHTVLVVFDPAVINELLSRKSHHQYVKGNNYRLSKPLVGNGLLSTHGDVWHRQRSVADQGFKLTTLEATAAATEKTVAELVQRWERTRKVSGSDFLEVDISIETLKLTLDVLGRGAWSL